MLIACWSAKGGSGTTVVAAALGLLHRRGHPGGVLLVDLAGDLPAVLGLAEPEGPGLAGWSDAGDEVPVDALARLEIPVGDGVSLLPRGRGEVDPSRGDVLAALLGADGRVVVADCGTGPTGAALAVAAGATRCVLVTRPCYLSLRRAVGASLVPSEIVLVGEPGRALDRHDVEHALGAPVRHEVPVDPAVARAVDAGLLAARLPRTLERGLRRAA